MHPHRGFNECPYLKQGRWIATDPWNMEGEGDDALFAEGQLQWGKSGCGIEHGMKFDPTCKSREARPPATLLTDLIHS